MEIFVAVLLLSGRDRKITNDSGEKIRSRHAIQVLSASNKSRNTIEIICK